MMTHIRLRLSLPPGSYRGLGLICHCHLGVMGHKLEGWAKEFRVLKVWRGSTTVSPVRLGGWVCMDVCVCVCSVATRLSVCKKVGFHSVTPGKLIFRNEIKYWVQRLFYNTHSPLQQIHLCKRKWPCLIKTRWISPTEGYQQVTAVWRQLNIINACLVKEPKPN